MPGKVPPYLLSDSPSVFEAISGGDSLFGTGCSPWVGLAYSLITLIPLVGVLLSPADAQPGNAYSLVHKFNG